MKGIFGELNNQFFVLDMENAFKKKQIKIKSITFSEDKKRSTIITKTSDKIIIEGENKKFKWTLNALSMGEVCGNDICDIAGQYEYELSKGDF